MQKTEFQKLFSDHLFKSDKVALLIHFHSYRLWNAMPELHLSIRPVVPIQHT